ncbi:MAG: 3,4-dehydroadipyl-CoA semialdehyde dehydrogenase [Acidobacteria bacterium]|nr:3,4-dehydroadipyl-CoA semialdehyde dehydrogenase [Acidobacteriota bacterium]
MTQRLRSYVRDNWVDGEGDLAQLVNPTTEEALAETTTAGIDFGAALAHARDVGGPALRDMTFAERGKLLQAMASEIHKFREELVDLAIANGGNTRGDAKFDIDGATGTLHWYASLGEKLGNRRILVDGDSEQLTRSPKLVGQHIYQPLTGAAVFINAFNFPAWGFGEKAATAILAGMPVVTKPATSTAVVAWRIAEILVDACLMPKGSLTLLCGGAGDLLDHLTSQDVVAFTGSSDTGATIRSHASVVRHNTRVNVEADSLNAAVLGADVEHGSDTYEMFLREVAKDVTQKAGQKCTAIRRVFVPEAMVAQVREDLADRMREVKVGDPNLAEVRMGPLATARQLKDVRAGVDRLRSVCEVVLGDVDIAGNGRGMLTGVDNDKGFFLSPTLLVAPSLDCAEVHGFEVFGPVATILPYSPDASNVAGVSSLIDAIRLGGGGLVSSIYTDDIEIARAFVTGAGPYHGRLTIGGAKVAEHSPGPGAVLPMMIHGGPGRAGGGEELGGLRGITHFMQRTAVQGYGPLLEKLWG